jgi:methyl-accepting chemotaxis protein
MKKIANLSVGARLAMGFGIVLALMTALTVVAISRMAFIQENLDKIVKVEAAKIRLVNEMRDVVRFQSVTIRDVVMQEDISLKRPEMKRMKQAGAIYRAAADKLALLLTDTRGKQAMVGFATLDAKVKAAIDEALDKSISDDHVGAADVIRDKVRPAQLEFVAALDALLKELEAGSRDSAAQAAAAYTSALRMLLLLAAVALVAGLVIAYLIQRSVAHPLRRAVVVAERVADGDLSQLIESNSTDEVGQLLSALGKMSASLRDIATTIKTSAESVSIGSREIASGNMDLSSRTETQASALEQTAASMDELSSTVRQNAENARHASDLAMGATEVAVRGGEVVGDVVSTMKRINESSRKIAEIISVIDGIAFQTNILALNAAVEAARAGEQGRGFAVVASEVRNLAQRSATAAKDIKALISASVERVEQGTALVDQAGGTIDEIVTAIRRVASIVGEISNASVEQSAGVAQVGEAITQMDHATQQNAALVEESAAAAEGLKQQAQLLVQAVSVFKLNHDGQGGADSAQAEEAQGQHSGERRGPNRAQNVARIASPRRAIDDSATDLPRLVHR